uniref:Uncharacterized protein n=1 Tax=Arundo donax TaxID=35708 RepID=A0A0A9EUP0_ARUDO
MELLDLCLFCCLHSSRLSALLHLLPFHVRAVAALGCSIQQSRGVVHRRQRGQPEHTS